jgi:hypothetical protein
MAWGEKENRTMTQTTSVRRTREVTVPATALRRVIDYLWIDERHHFLDCQDSEDGARRHIFSSVVTLKAAMDGEDRTAIMRRIVHGAYE